MALLVESYVVVMRLSSIKKRFPGRFEEFGTIIPKGVFYTDNNLLAVGFINSDDVEIFKSILQEIGFSDGEVVVVSQINGLRLDSDWLSLSKFKMEEGGHIVDIVFSKNEIPQEFIAPEGWQYKGGNQPFI